LGADYIKLGAGADTVVYHAAATVDGSAGGGEDRLVLSDQSVTSLTVGANLEGFEIFDATSRTIWQAITIVGSNANESIFGGSGSDRLDGLGGSDWVDGRGGDDKIVYNDSAISIIGGDGIDWLTVPQGFSGTLGSNFTNFEFIDARSSSNFSNAAITVFGSNSPEWIYGGEGGAGNFLSGGLGDDTIVAGNKNDTIAGGDGRDSIVADDGFDFIVMTGSLSAGSRDSISLNENTKVSDTLYFEMRYGTNVQNDDFRMDFPWVTGFSGNNEAQPDKLSFSPELLTGWVGDRVLYRRGLENITTWRASDSVNNYYDVAGTDLNPPNGLQSGILVWDVNSVGQFSFDDRDEVADFLNTNTELHQVGESWIFLICDNEAGVDYTVVWSWKDSGVNAGLPGHRLIDSSELAALAVLVGLSYDEISNGNFVFPPPPG
jgi:Ca2+-binding RTX toxin-like protein